MMNPIVCSVGRWGSLSTFLCDLDSALSQHFLFFGGLGPWWGNKASLCWGHIYMVPGRSLQSAFCIEQCPHLLFCLSEKERKEDLPVVSVGWLSSYAQDNGFGNLSPTWNWLLLKRRKEKRIPTIIIRIINRELHRMCILYFACCTALKV